MEKERDEDQITSLYFVAERGLAFINKIPIDKESADWTFVFREYYESLRGFIEAFLLSKGIAATNHVCKNASVCDELPELNWGFLETIRQKRNAINYEGKLMHEQEWRSLQAQFERHIALLRREIAQIINTEKYR